MPVENPRKWCSIHAFYDCPVCRGEPIEWEIPVINDRTGERTGTVSITEQGDVAVVGQIVWTSDRTERIHVLQPTPRPAVTLDAPLPPIADDLPNAGLAERLESIIPSVYERMMKVPRWRKAAAKGRRLHERAEALAKEEGISYAEALESLV